MDNATKALLDVIATHQDDSVVAFAKRCLVHHLLHLEKQARVAVGS